MSLPTLVFVGPALACALAWLGLGRALPARFLPADPLLAALTRVGAGATVLSTAFLLLGRVGAFDRWVLVAITAALAPIGLWTAWEVARSAPRLSRQRGVAAALLALTALALLLDVLGATAPPTSADALVYHVELPDRWLSLGRIDDPFWNYAAFYPLGIDMLFAQGLAVAGPSTASAVAGLFGVLAALAVFGLGRELGGGRLTAAAAAAALFTLQGAVTWDATSTFVDMGLTFYVALAAWYVVRYTRSADRRSAVLAGAFCGAAASTKYVGPLAVAFVLLPLAVVARRRLGDLAAALAVTLLVGGAWYLKNAIVTGNPTYPLFFGGKNWTAYAARELEGTARAVFPGTHGGNPLRILILPIDLLLHGDRFDRGQYLGTAIFVFALAALVLLRRNRRVVGALLAAGGYTLVWWYVQPQGRYLMPALAVLAAVGGVAVAQLVDRGGVIRATTLAILAAAAVAWAIPSAALERRLLPVAFGAETRTEHVQKLLGMYDVLRAVGARVGTDELVGFAGYRFLFWYPGAAIELGRPEFGPDLSHREYVERLRKERVRWILLQYGLGQLEPIRDCLRYVATYRGRYVTSRTRGTSFPLALRLYSTERCLAERNASVSRSPSGVPIS